MRCNYKQNNDCATDEEADQFLKNYIFEGFIIEDKIDFSKFGKQPVTRVFKPILYY